MAVYKRGNVYWYKFSFGNRLIRESAKTHLKTLAKEAERQRRRELEERYNNISKDDRNRRVMTVSEAAKGYFEGYETRHPNSAKYCRGCISHLVEHLGKKMIIEIDEDEVQRYQNLRLKEGAAGKTINEEVGELFRIMGKRGRVVRLALKEEKKLRLHQREDCGIALEVEGGEETVICCSIGKIPVSLPNDCTSTEHGNA